MCELTSIAICAVVEQPDHHCGDDLALYNLFFFCFRRKQVLRFLQRFHNPPRYYFLAVFGRFSFVINRHLANDVETKKDLHRKSRLYALFDHSDDLPRKFPPTEEAVD